LTGLPELHWMEDGVARSARWQSESGLPPPTNVVVVDDRTAADAAFRLARKGTALLWRGDYHNARHLLDALARRVERHECRNRRDRESKRGDALDARRAFDRHRAHQAQRARILSLLLLPVDAGHVLPLRRAPDVAQACVEAHGPAADPYLMALRELLGIIGAHEWRKKGIAIAALGARIHPHYGVFAPIRSEYVDLVATAPFAGAVPEHAFDVGTGTGVLAAVLAQRGVARVMATDSDPRAVACARENIERLGLGARIEVTLRPFFPDGLADLIVCNPPWLPGRPSASIERAIFDPDSEMLRGFLGGLAEHLAPRGEGWLILSDFAERLGLRSRDWLLQQIRDAGLAVAGRLDTKPRHPKAADAEDALHAVRAAEIVSLWRLTRG
jgi:methylase of polypeptide subunit release factors